VGLRKGIGDVNVMQVSDHLNMSSDMFVVREEVFQQKKDLLKAFVKGYRESAAWMMANPEEASVLASKYAIDGTRRDINLDVIRLRNASSMPAVQGSRWAALIWPRCKKAPMPIVRWAWCSVRSRWRMWLFRCKSSSEARCLGARAPLSLREGTTASLRGGEAVKAPACCPCLGPASV
jgi:hypothetical protein